MSTVYINKMESHGAAPSLKATRALAKSLTCKPQDLMEVPTPARLAEIRAAWHNRQAELATADATRLAASGS